MIDDIAVVLQELKHLRAGVADTSTLIYLEKIDLLSLVVRSYYFTVIPQVAQEFGRSLSGVTLYEEILDAPADKAIVEAARRGKLAVFSEDRKVLMTADKIGLPYYNTLMLVLSLFSRDIIDQARCRELMRRLLRIARYGPAVVNFGEQMYDALQEKRCPIMTPCPCVSGKEFDSCCGIYLFGLASAPTAEALMRSRYTAYTKNRYDYLLDTWYPSTRPTLESLTAPSDHSWTGLEILNSSGGNPEDLKGMVEFIAHFRASGIQQQLYEKSSFVRENNHWYYVDGDNMVEASPRSIKVGRNDPCPCGSGKKYKKCCREK